jgi:hypothetical protein
MSIPSLPSRDALLDHQRRQREDGYTFPLAATSLGMDTMILARVRRLSTTDRAAIEALPTAVQETVWSGIKAFAASIKDGQDAQSLIEAAAKNDEQRKAADGFCIAAFIEPPLVATEAELATNPGAYLVTDIAAEDRISFMYACLDADSVQAKQLKMFRPKSPEHVSPVAAQPNPAASLYAVEPAG